MKKIVVADDSNLIRMKLKKHLMDEFEVVEAINGRDALVKIKVEQPDIVLSDLLMPEMDGFELLRRIQLDELNVPVVILTADIQVETNQKCTDLGAYRVLNKPPNRDELLLTLNEALSANTNA
ncbi:response regulator [bacterium]|nr:MAG: response regulator [bacterium]